MSEKTKLYKYIAWCDSKDNNEVWFLIDAPNETKAREYVMAEPNEELEINAILLVEPNNSPGVSHRFTLNEI